MGIEKICADCDIIIDDNLIDIKTFSMNKIIKKDFVQLLIYASLYYIKKNICIKRLIIYNPLYNSEFVIEIDKETIIETIKYLKSLNFSLKKK